MRTATVTAVLLHPCAPPWRAPALLSPLPCTTKRHVALSSCDSNCTPWTCHAGNSGCPPGRQQVDASVKSYPKPLTTTTTTTHARGGVAGLPRSMPLKLVDATRRASFLSSHNSRASCTRHVLPPPSAAAHTPALSCCQKTGAKYNQECIQRPCTSNRSCSTLLLQTPATLTSRTAIQGVRNQPGEGPHTPSSECTQRCPPQTQRLVHAVGNCHARETHCC